MSAASMDRLLIVKAVAPKPHVLKLGWLNFQQFPFDDDLERLFAGIRNRWSHSRAS